MMELILTAGFFTGISIAGGVGTLCIARVVVYAVDRADLPKNRLSKVRQPVNRLNEHYPPEKENIPGGRRSECRACGAELDCCNRTDRYGFDMCLPCEDGVAEVLGDPTRREKNMMRVYETAVRVSMNPIPNRQIAVTPAGCVDPIRQPPPAYLLQ